MACVVRAPRRVRATRERPRTRRRLRSRSFRLPNRRRSSRCVARFAPCKAGGDHRAHTGEGKCDGPRDDAEQHERRPRVTAGRGDNGCEWPQQQRTPRDCEHRPGQAHRSPRLESRDNRVMLSVDARHRDQQPTHSERNEAGGAGADRPLPLGVAHRFDPGRRVAVASTGGACELCRLLDIGARRFSRDRPAGADRATRR
jgi:hypothetical protein